MKEAIATANPNVALVKYWGKRDEELNLPYTGSISVALAGLTTTAAVLFTPDLGQDRIFINGNEADPDTANLIQAFLNLIRRDARQSTKADVRITSNFPMAAGLASSASTFAALALAGCKAAGLALSPRELSILARRGSGSAARSIFGGYVEWFAGEASDGSDSYAVQLAPPRHWQLGIVIAITDERRKRVGSREGMAHVAKHSPFFPAWLASHDADLDAVRRGIQNRDLQMVGQAAEHNCLKMHATAMGAQPSLIYWVPATLAVMRRVACLREQGLSAYFSIDAGPQVKVICPWTERATVTEEISQVPGVERVVLSEPGTGAQLVP